jgi:DME family drug/metabolite transporter
MIANHEERLIKVNLRLLLIVLAAVLFGTAGISAKYLINVYSLSALTIGAVRLLIASPILFTISRIQLRGKAKTGIKHYILFIIYGVAVAAYQITYFSAVRNIMVSIATLIALCTAPVFVAILSRVFIKESINTVIIFSFFLSIAGTVLIIGIGGNQPDSNTNYLGYILALAAGLSYAVYALCGKILVVHYPSSRVISISFTLGALLMLPFIKLPGGLTWRAWVVLLYLGAVPTAVAYILFTEGLKKSSATKAAIATLAEPLTSAVLSVLFMGEEFSLNQILGVVLLSVALILLLFNNLFESLCKKSGFG